MGEWYDTWWSRQGFAGSVKLAPAVLCRAAAPATTAANGRQTPPPDATTLHRCQPQARQSGETLAAAPRTTMASASLREQATTPAQHATHTGPGQKPLSAAAVRRVFREFDVDASGTCVSGLGSQGAGSVPTKGQLCTSCTGQRKLT